MEREWPTEIQDMIYAKTVLEEYAAYHHSETFEFFELFVDKSAKRMGFCLAKWVVVLANYFHTQYGPDQGDFVVRQIIGRYLVNGSVLH